MPPYDDLWPAEYRARRSRWLLLDRKYSRQFYLEQARAFVWGQQPTMANFLPAHLTERPEEMDYVDAAGPSAQPRRNICCTACFCARPAARARVDLRLVPPVDLRRAGEDRLTAFQKHHPLALAGAWRAPDGDVGIALASIADEPLDLSLPIDRDYYGLPKQLRVHRIDESGRRPLAAAGGRNGRLQLELPPLGPWILEFSDASRHGSERRPRRPQHPSCEIDIEKTHAP